MDQAERLRSIVKENNPVKKPLARVLTVTSGKGGVGKSNTAINLAVHFREMGQRVVILDADFGLANIEIMFGAVPKYNLRDVIDQKRSIGEIISAGPMDIGFISGGSGITGLSNLSKDEIVSVVKSLAELDELADTIFIDTGAGMADAVLEFLVASGEVLLVTTPEPTSITDAYSLLKALNRHPDFQKEETKIKMIANRVEDAAEGESLYRKFQTVVTKYLGIPIEYLGAVPEDEHVSKAVMQQMPVSIQDPKSRAAVAYKSIAMKLTDTETEQHSVRRGIAAFFAHLVGK